MDNGKKVAEAVKNMQDLFRKNNVVEQVEKEKSTCLSDIRDVIQQTIKENNIDVEEFIKEVYPRYYKENSYEVDMKQELDKIKNVQIECLSQIEELRDKIFYSNHYLFRYRSGEIDQDLKGYGIIRYIKSPVIELFDTDTEEVLFTITSGEFGGLDIE